MNMSSQSRILANLSSKENMSPRRKRSSEEAFSTFPENMSKRRTIDSHLVSSMKSKSIFSLKPSNKINMKKQSTLKNYYRDGAKPNTGNKMKIFEENKEKVKPKSEDEGFSLMCAEQAPEKYWELLAEERRVGLEKALHENQELAEEIREKDNVIIELRTEVKELKETAEHAEYLATVLEELGKDCNVSNDDEESESESEDEVFEEKDYSDSYSDAEGNDDKAEITTTINDESSSMPKIMIGSSSEDKELVNQKEECIPITMKNSKLKEQKEPGHQENQKEECQPSTSVKTSIDKEQEEPTYKDASEQPSVDNCLASAVLVPDDKLDETL